MSEHAKPLEYTYTICAHYRDFLLFALDRWIGEGLNGGEAVSIRNAILNADAHGPLFDQLRAQITDLRTKLSEHEALKAATAKSIGFLLRIEQELLIPAAEYVPAIPAVHDLITDVKGILQRALDKDKANGS